MPEVVLIAPHLFVLARRYRWLLVVAALCLALLWVVNYILSGDVKVIPHPGTLRIEAQPLNLDSEDPHRTTLGRLEFRQAWALTSSEPSFGGISSMRRLADGGFLAINDTGVLFHFPLPPSRAGQYMRPLPIRPQDRGKPPTYWDSESQTYDPASGRNWVGFELSQQVCRYAQDFARIEGCKAWPETKRWPVTGSIEAMTRLPDGRFILFSEMGAGRRGGNDVLLFDSDPVTTRRHPMRLNYYGPVGYRPTDSVWIGRDRLLVLNRRATLLSGFTAVITLVDLHEAKDNGILHAQEIARLEPPVLSDNFEALAVEKRDGESILWVASDDNHLFFQRTLLLSFRLPPDLALP